MRRNLYTIICAVLVGIFIGKFVLNQYDVSVTSTATNIVENLYFIKQGEYQTLEELQSNMGNIQNYIYIKDNNLYKAYLGITKESDNVNKIQNYFQQLGISTTVEQMMVGNSAFLTVLDQYDLMLKSSSENQTISAVCSQVLAKYVEIIQNDKNEWNPS